MEVPSFLIKNGSTDFVNKQKNLFDLLETAEKETKKTNPTNDEFMEIDEIKSNKRKRKETKQFRGKESLFKEPVELPRRFKKNFKVPDFQRNPHKWVKYSLADITQDDMSNESNTAAALSFLRDIKIQKKLNSIKVEKDDGDDGVDDKTIPCQSNLHQFKVPGKIDKKELSEQVSDTKSEKPVFKSTKLVMPEYVVGQMRKESKPFKKKAAGERIKEVYLNHIHEYEDE